MVAWMLGVLAGPMVLAGLGVCRCRGPRRHRRLTHEQIAELEVPADRGRRENWNRPAPDHQRPRHLPAPGTAVMASPPPALAAGHQLGRPDRESRPATSAADARASLRQDLAPCLQKARDEIPIRLMQHLDIPVTIEPAGRAEDWLQGRGDLLIAGMAGPVPLAAQAGALAHADLNRLANLGRRRGCPIRAVPPAPHPRRHSPARPPEEIAIRPAFHHDLATARVAGLHRHAAGEQAAKASSHVGQARRVLTAARVRRPVTTR